MFLIENWSDIDTFYDIYEDECTHSAVLEHFLYNRNTNIWFPLIKPTEYKQALTEFMKMGDIVRFPEDKIRNWLKIIFRNTMILSSMTDLAGHSSYFPFDACQEVFSDCEDLETDYYTYKEFLEKQGYYDWAKLPDGSPACSDYGIEPIIKIINEYNENMKASEILVLVNRCLDVWHHQGDLASAFIEGGSKSLTQISNECFDIKGNIICESINEILRISGSTLCESNQMDCISN